MKIGGHFSKDDAPLSSVFQRVDQLGAKAVQVFLGPQTRIYPPRFSAEHNAAFKAEVEARQLEVAAHAPYVLNIVYPGKLSEQSVNAVVRHLELCDEMGIKYFVMHPGSSKEMLKAQAYSFFRSSLELILERLPKGGKSMLLIENVAGGGTQFGSITEITTALSDLYTMYGTSDLRVGMCFDSAHAFAAGVPMDQPEARRATLMEVLPYVRWMHFNNPDRNVELGSHKDRHSFAWSQSKWPIEVMIEMAKEWGPIVPLCMEARDEHAYDFNFMVLEEANLV